MKFSGNASQTKTKLALASLCLASLTSSDKLILVLDTIGQ
jgi:hypothetical protein